MTWEPPADLRRIFEKDPCGEAPTKVCCRWHSEDSPSLAVYRDHCFCFGCRVNKGWYDSVREFGVDPRDLGPDDEPPLADQVGVSSGSGGRADLKPMSTRELLDLAKFYHERMLAAGKDAYFRARGLTDKTVSDYWLGHTGRAYVIPVWDHSQPPTEDLITLRFRRDDEITSSTVMKSKYWGLPGRNGVHLFAPEGLGPKVVWCEGELDALLACQTGYTAVSLTNGIGADVTPVLARFAEAGVEELVVATDQDAPGFSRALELTQAFRDVVPKVRIARFFAKDLTDLHQSKGPDAVRAALGGTSPATARSS